MKPFIDSCKTVSIALFAVVLSACAGLRIDPPSTENSTLLLLPVEVTYKAQTNQHGFYYVYDIEGIDDPSITHEAIIKLPLRGDILIVDSLPPGRYRVSRLTFKPIGSGDFDYGNNRFSRNDRFSLEAGKITIFNRSLHVTLYNRTPGRGMTTSYSIDLEPVTADQIVRIREALQKSPGFQAWKL